MKEKKEKKRKETVLRRVFWISINWKPICETVSKTFENNGFGRK